MAPPILDVFLCFRLRGGCDRFSIYDRWLHQYKMYFCVLGCEEAEIDLVFMIDGSTSITQSSFDNWR